MDEQNSPGTSCERASAIDKNLETVSILDNAGEKLDLIRKLIQEHGSVEEIRNLLITTDILFSEVEYKTGGLPEIVELQKRCAEVHERLDELENLRRVEKFFFLSLFSKKNGDSTKSGVTRNSPSSTMLTLIALISPRIDREMQIGCTIERFQRDVRKYGEKQAKRYLYIDFLKSCFSRICEISKSGAVHVLETVGLHVVVRHFFG